MALVQTHIGTVQHYHSLGFVVTGTQSDLSLWANRPGERWPCSALAGIAPDATVTAEYDHRGDLVDLSGDPEDLMSDELTAWTADVLRAAGFTALADDQNARLRH